MILRHRLSLWTLALTILIAVALHGCGGTGFSNVPQQSESDVAADTDTGRTVVPGEMLFGRLQVMPAATLQGLDPEVIAALQAARPQLEQRGMRLTDDLLVWPLGIGAGWTIRLGEQVVLSDANGAFSLTAPEDTTQTLKLSHPSGDEGLGEVEISLSQLSADPDNPQNLIIPIGFSSPCGMTEGDTDEFCVANPTTEQQTSQILARYLPPNWIKAGDPKGRDLGVRRDRLGTYPPDADYIDAGCPDIDGFLSPFIDPEGFTIPFVERKGGELLDYLGSTCDLNVLDGACVNEVSLSDLEYKTLRLVFGKDALKKLGIVNAEFATPLSRVKGSAGTCKLNHKGRPCGNFLMGDLSLDLGGDVVRNGTVTLQVEPGQTGSFTVHNNGVFGYTNISYSASPDVDKVSLSGERFERIEPSVLHYRLAHFVSPAANTYTPDQTLNFRVSEAAQDGDKIPVTFQVDDRSINVTFQVTRVRIVPFFAALRAGESRAFEVVTSSSDPAGRIFEWSLANATGTLASSRGKRITYKAGDGGPEEQFDTLTVKVIDRTSGGGTVVVGTSSANIRISPNTTAISPPSSTLSVGDSQLFTVNVTGQSPDAVLTYQWTTAAGFGTLSSTDQPTATYTVKDDVEPPQTDAVNVKVFRRVNGLDTEIADLTAAISIVDLTGGNVGLVYGSDPNFAIFRLTGLSLQPATGQLTVQTSTFDFAKNAGFALFGERFALRPGLGHGYFSYADPAGIQVIDGFHIDTTTGALSNPFNVGTGGALAVGKDKLYVGKSYEPGSPIPTQRYSLDGSGAATLDAFTVPGPDVRPTTILLLRDDQGDDVALYQTSGVALTGHRVGAALATAQAVTGSPFTPSGTQADLRTPMLHPSGRFLVVPSWSSTFGIVQFDAVEIDPATGDFLGQRGSIQFTGGFPVSRMTAKGVILTEYSLDLDSFTRMTTLDASGQFSALNEVSGVRLVGSDSSGDHAFAVTGFFPNVEIQTYKISASGGITLTDTDPINPFFSIFFQPQE